MNTVEERRNWAGNQIYSAARFHTPETVEQLQNILSNSRKVKVLGSRHSFNQIADTPEDLISLDNFNRVVQLDKQNLTVCVEGCIRYGELSQYLHSEGYALHNLASLPHISVAGACATATHGSGVRNGNLATAVSGIELLKADGELVTLYRENHRNELDGAVVGLGALGIVTKLTLEISPTYDVAQTVFENLPLSSLENNFDEIVSSAYSTSFFTDWKNPKFNQVWFKHQANDNIVDLEQFGATPAKQNLHPLPGLPVANCTPQMGIPGPWHERLPHFRMEFTPSNGEELQSEYIIPQKYAFAALRAVEQLSDKITPLLQMTEIRTIAADNLWMSPCYRQSCIGIHFTWLKNWPEVQKVLPLIEASLKPFEARPHWGKLFTMKLAEIQAMFEKLPEFRELATRYDPNGKFRNPFLDINVFGA